MQTQVLAKHPDVSLRVFAVWFDMYEGDDRARWRASILDDARVSHYWDESKSVGTWFAAQRDAYRKDGDVLWDAWLLYGADARWDDEPGPLLGYGRTIVATKTRLLEAVSALPASRRPAR